MTRFPLFVACAFVAGSLVVPTASAQEATPPTGEVVPAAECQVPARDFTELNQLIGTPTARATPDVEQADQPQGEKADQATVDAVTATYRQLVACINAGDFARVYALYSEGYLRELLSAGEISLDQFQATPAPPAEQQQTSLVGVSDVRRLEGDFVSARVSTINPTVETPVVIDTILVRSGDSYLIDQETVADAPTEGTPAQ
jgi:hypothetical protein